MRSEEIYALAVELSADNIIGTDDEALDADDIYPVLLALSDRGISLRRNGRSSFSKGGSVAEIGVVASFIRERDSY